jgi:hypothetical protein
MFGVFRVKNHDFTQTNRIFSNFPSESAPAFYHRTINKLRFLLVYLQSDTSLYMYIGQI